MSRSVCIEVDNQYLHFSAAHFTIFSATERERLHGHNFTVSAKAQSELQADGLTFNYQVLKQCLRDICDSLDEYTLIAGHSPHLHITEEGEYYAVTFNDQKMLLLQSDSLLLPLHNITLEELGYYVIQRLIEDGLFEKLVISSLAIAVASGPGQRIISVYQP